AVRHDVDRALALVVLHGIAAEILGVAAKGAGAEQLVAYAGLVAFLESFGTALELAGGTAWLANGDADLCLADQFLGVGVGNHKEALDFVGVVGVEQRFLLAAVRQRNGFGRRSQAACAQVFAVIDQIQGGVIGGSHQADLHGVAGLDVDPVGYFGAIGVCAIHTASRDRKSTRLNSSHV